jgi:uncharacterized protein YqhQ
MLNDTTQKTNAEGGVPIREQVNVSGQTIFSTVNIIIGILMCCCVVGIIPLAFGILAAVFVSESKKARTVDEAESRIKTALLLNIISTVSIMICLALLVLLSVWMKSNIDLSDTYRDLFA